MACVMVRHAVIKILCMTILGLFTSVAVFVWCLHEFVERHLCPLDVAAPSATGA